MGRDLELAKQGQAVALQLDTDIDVARGAVLVPGRPSADRRRAASRRASCGCGRRRSTRRAGYFLRTATDLAPISTISIKSLLDLETLIAQPSEKCGVNDIAIASITLGRPVAVDTFADNQPTGAFLIVDALTGATVAGGVISKATKGGRRQRLGLQADARAAGARVCAAISATATKTAASSSGAPARRRCCCTLQAFRLKSSFNGSYVARWRLRYPLYRTRRPG